MANERMFMKPISLLRAALLWCLAALLLPPVAAAPAAGRWLDPHPRIAVISAFDAELALLRAHTRHTHTYTLGGTEFTTGELEGRPVVLLLSGVSMTNAAMNAQRVIDRFRVTGIVFSGIAGGVNPALHIGDVVVPQRWSSYLESVLAREVRPGEFEPPSWMNDAKELPHFGMFHPRGVEVRHAGAVGRRRWFEVDPAMYEAARGLVDVPLRDCSQPGTCLSHAPALVLGGEGVSGQSFVDNAQFRDYVFNAFHASVLDMETAAVAQVADDNRVPFLAFRSLSDLAGGGEGENQIQTFFQLAADNSARVVMAFLKRWPR
jgi:adenosylhomocysteine nucleosidase